MSISLLSASTLMIRDAGPRATAVSVFALPGAPTYGRTVIVIALDCSLTALPLMPGSPSVTFTEYVPGSVNV
jgi:hypothetical protein